MNIRYRGSERRKAERAPMVVDLFYKIEEPPQVKIRFGDRLETAYIDDVSIKGVGFACGVAIPEGTELEITFNITDKRIGVVKVHASGVVRHCSFLTERQVYRIGLAFTIIEPAEEILIARYVNSLPKKKAQDTDAANP